MESTKKKHRVIPFKSSIKSIEIDTTSKFKPLAYFVRGGVDLTGQETKLDAKVSYDNEKTISEMEEKGTICAIGVCSPNVDVFDIVEKSNNTSAATDGVKNDVKKSE